MPHVSVSRPPGRYGDDRPAWHRSLARVLTACLAAVGVAFLLWVAVDGSRDRVTHTDIGFDLDSAPGEVTVDFQVSMDPGTAATCTLRALNANFAVVGITDVPLEASQARSRRLTATVRVSEPAVSAGVQSCVAR